MWSFKEIIIFITGAQVFHTFSHFFMYYVGFPPFQFMSWMVTPQFMLWTGILNLIITFLFFWWLTKFQ